MRGALPALVFLSIGVAGRPVFAAPIVEHTATTVAQATAPASERDATLTITVVPRSDSGVFRDTALVYLDGRIDAGAPDRLSRALDGVKGKTAIWLNSPGGNLFAGMHQYKTLGLVWFDEAQHDGIDHQDWRIEDNPVAETAFRLGIAGLTLTRPSG